MQAMDRPGYDESSKVLFDRGSTQTGRIMEHELTVQKDTESTRVMVGDEMVRGGGPKRLETIDPPETLIGEDLME